MSKRTTGIILILAASLLLISCYITAAITANGSGIALIGVFKDIFTRTIPMLIISFLGYVFGIIYLVWAERTKEK